MSTTAVATHTRTHGHMCKTPHTYTYICNVPLLDTVLLPPRHALLLIQHHGPSDSVYVYTYTVHVHVYKVQILV